MALLAELRAVQRRAEEDCSPTRRCRSCRTTPRPRWRASRTWSSDPKLAKTIANLERTLTRARPASSAAARADLATTIENLRQITDNLRDLTEETKRYPANLIFGAPPRPAGAQAMTSAIATRVHRARCSSRCAAALRRRAAAFTRPAPVKETYLLEPALPPPVAKAQPGSLRVGTVNVARAVPRPHVRLSRGRAQVRDRLLPRVLRAAGRDDRATRRRARSTRRKVFADVTRPGVVVDADWVLDGFVGALYADARDAAKPEAVLQITYYLSRDDGGASAPVWSQAYGSACRSRRPTRAPTSPRSIRRSREILAELTRDLAAGAAAGAVQRATSRTAAAGRVPSSLAGVGGLPVVERVGGDDPAAAHRLVDVRRRREHRRAHRRERAARPGTATARPAAPSCSDV